MTNIPKLTEAAIRKRTGDRSFGLGRSYFERGAIFDARRAGVTLKARCSGSRGEAYRVHATFNAKGVAAAECSCPVGDGGFCKHVAALLLTWIERPEEFSEAEEIGAFLRSL